MSGKTVMLSICMHVDVPDKMCRTKSTSIFARHYLAHPHAYAICSALLFSWTLLDTMNIHMLRLCLYMVQLLATVYFVTAFSSFLSTVTVTRFVGMEDELNILCFQDGLVDLFLKITQWTEYHVLFCNA